MSDVAAVTVLPASEGFSVPGEDVAKERRILPDGPLSDLFALLPDAQLAVMEGFESRIEDWLTLVRDSYRIALTTLREGAPPPPEPARLYLDQDEVGVLLAGRHLLKVRIDDEPDEPATTLAAAARRALELASQGMRVVVCADLPTQTFRDTVARRMRRDTSTVLQLPDWPAAQRLHPGDIGVMSVGLRNGFRLSKHVVLAVQTMSPALATRTRVGDQSGALALGDLVVELDRGLAELNELVTEEQAGTPFDCRALAFRSGERLLVPATEAGRVWRYGAGGSMPPDRLEGTAWRERREQTEREIATAAATLIAQMREREAQPAPVIEPGEKYRRFVRAMPFAPTPDQASAIRSVQQELAAGHPMFRLACGDVGFGKTEVALHTTALAAFAGYQVAVAAPTTLLARQHLNVFRRR